MTHVFCVIFCAIFILVHCQQDWNLCAIEGGYCSLNASANVRYGIDGAWHLAHAHPPGFVCGVEHFGKDPWFGRIKLCEVADSNWFLAKHPAKRGYRIFDAFTFNGEWDMLEMRVRTLAPAVNFFVICESNLTFSGQPKPLYLTENSEFLSEFRHRMRIVYADLRNKKSDSWKNEDASRDALLTGLEDALAEDWIIVSDLDEIPKPHYLAHLANSDNSVGFPCRGTYYNYRFDIGIFGMPVACRIDVLRAGVTGSWRKASKKMPDGSCWHCSYCFGPTDDDFVNAVVTKLTSFSHTEFSSGKYIEREYILDCRDKGVSFFSPGFLKVNQDPLDAPPLVLRDSRFKYMLGKRVANGTE